MENKEISLDQATGQEKNIVDDIHQKINDFTREVFLDTLDEEMIAIIICNKAMSKLPDLSKARVLKFLQQKYLEKWQADRDLLKSCMSDFENELKAHKSSFVRELDALSREMIQGFIDQVKDAAQDRPPEENEELLKMFESDDGGRAETRKNIEWSEASFENWGRGGLSVSGIAREVGVSDGAVSYHLKKENFSNAYEKGRNSRNISAAESQINE